MGHLLSLGVKHITTRQSFLLGVVLLESVYNTSVSELKRSERPSGARNGQYTVTVRLRLPTLFKNKNRLPDKFGTDLRSLGPIHACPCGSQVFNIMAAFEDYELAWYHLDATCVNCGNLVIVPCPVDKDE